METNYNKEDVTHRIKFGLSCGLSDRDIMKMINAGKLDRKEIDFISTTRITDLKKKILEELGDKHQKETKRLIAIGFDGKCGPVKMPNCKTQSLDKVSFTNSVTGDYIDHDLPKRSNGEENFLGAKNVLEKYESIESVTTVNTDGCKVMTGHTNGAIALLEAHLKRPLQHAICLLHCNEKVFTHVIEDIGEHCYVITH